MSNVVADVWFDEAALLEGLIDFKVVLGLKQECVDERKDLVFVLDDECTGSTSSTMRAAKHYLVLFSSICGHAIQDSRL